MIIKLRFLFLFSLIGPFAFGQPKGKLWHVSDTLGQKLFTVFADSVHSLGDGLFAANLGPECFLFKNDPMQQLARKRQVSFLHLGQSSIFEKDNEGLLRLMDSKKLTYLSNYQFDSVFQWKSHLFVRKHNPPVWLWNPGKENELEIDSITVLHQKLILWTTRGLIFLNERNQERFVAYPSSGRIFNPGFSYILSDSLWYPIQGFSNPIRFQLSAEWWNDTAYVDFSPKGVFLQSAFQARKRLGDSVKICSQRFMMVRQKKQWWVWTASGKRVKILLPIECKSINDSILAVKTSRQWKLVFLSGNHSDLNKTVTEPGFFQEGLLLVKAGKRYGFVDLQGFIRIACRYDTILPFVEGMAAIRLGNQWGFLDKDEKIAVQPHYQEVTPFRKGLSAVRKEQFWGLINTSGAEIQPFVFDQIVPEMGSGWKISKQGWKGHANFEGNILIQPRYSDCIEASQNWHFIIRNQRKGLVDPKGKVILPIDNQQIIFAPTQNLILFY